MADGTLALSATAVSIALIHTLAGPDHYLPFVAMARAGRWSLRKTLRVTFLCGLGHVGSSVALGLVGVALGIGVEKLEWIESARGDWAAWLLIAFGITYLTWGIWRAIRNRPHTHLHFHADGTIHSHPHTHSADHAHLHEPGTDEANLAPGQTKPPRWSPMALFIVFVFGPCEPLIPLIMYPAARHNLGGMILVTTLFAVVTIGTMLALVAGMTMGATRLRWAGLERFGHAMAGGVVTACGVAILAGL